MHILQHCRVKLHFYSITLLSDKALVKIPAAIQERFQCARPYGLTPKIAPARQMRRLTEVWRSRDALWEVTGSHVFNKITAETLTARNNFQSVFSTKVYYWNKVTVHHLKLCYFLMKKDNTMICGVLLNHCLTVNRIISKSVCLDTRLRDTSLKRCGVKSQFTNSVHKLSIDNDDACVVVVKLASTPMMDTHDTVIEGKFPDYQGKVFLRIEHLHTPRHF